MVSSLQSTALTIYSLHFTLWLSEGNFVSEFMSVPSNEEAVALSQKLILNPQQQQQQEQLSNLSGVVPIKKRRFLFIPPTSPSAEENPCSSLDKDDLEEDESNVPVKGMLDTVTEDDSLGKVNGSTSFDLIVKKELITDTGSEFAQASIDISDCSPEEAKFGIGVGPSDDFRNTYDILLNEKSGEPEIPRSGVSAYLVTVNQDLVCKKTKGSEELKLFPDPKKDGLFLRAKKPYVSSIKYEKDENVSSVLGKQNMPFLSLGMSEGRHIFPHKENSGISDFGSHITANRSSWDLNTTADAWVSLSSNNEYAGQNAGVGNFGVINEEKHGMDEQSSSSSNTSVPRSHQLKPDGVHALSLAMMRTGTERSSVSNNTILKLGREPLSTMHVKPEPVDEDSRPDCSTGYRDHSELPNLCTAKSECAANYSSEITFSSSINPLKSEGYESIRSDALLESNMETCKSADAVPPQSDQKTVQQQQNSASSVVLYIPSKSLIPNPSKFLICAKFPIHGEISNQLGNSNFHDSENCAPALAYEHSQEIRGNDPGGAKAREGEMSSISAEMLDEDSLGSDCISHRDHVFDVIMDLDEKLYDKQQEDGKVQDSLKHLGEEAVVEEKKTEKDRMQFTDFSIKPNNIAVDFYKVDIPEENDRDSELVLGCDELRNEDESLPIQQLGKGTEVYSHDKKYRSVTPEKSGDPSGSINLDSSRHEEAPMESNECQRAETTLECDASDKAMKEISPQKHESTFPMVESPVNSSEAARIVNKGRVINLPCASAVTTPCKPKSVSTSLLTSGIRKGINSDPNEELHPRENRYQQYIDASNKLVTNRIYAQAFKNSGSSDRRGKRRVCSRSGPLHKDWAYGNDYVSESYSGRVHRQATRHKYPSSIATDVELKCNGYGTKPDGYFFASKWNSINNKLAPFCRPDISRFSPGDKDGQGLRGNKMLSRFPRDIDSNRSTADDNLNLVECQHRDIPMHHRSEDIRDPTFSSLYMYGEIDDRLSHGNEKFSSALRKDYPQFHSKSPVRLPGPSSPSLSHGFSEGHYGSTDQFRRGRMRFADRTSFHNEMSSGGQASPYITRRARSPRYLDSREYHAHPKFINSIRRAPPGHTFQRTVDVEDIPHGREDNDELSNGSLSSNKFQELRDDENTDGRRKFNKRHRLTCSFGPSNTEKYNLYHDGIRPDRSSGHAVFEFDERIQPKEKEPNIHMRTRKVEKRDGVHRSSGRFKHADGLYQNDGVKRQRCSVLTDD